MTECVDDYYLELPDGTIKQRNPFTGTQVWTVPGGPPDRWAGPSTIRVPSRTPTEPRRARSASTGTCRRRRRRRVSSTTRSVLPLLVLTPQGLAAQELTAIRAGRDAV